jgi:hypothetical protein
MAKTPSAFIQEYFRIRSDDSVGLNANSGWAAAENANATIGTGNPFRIRFKVRETATGEETNFDFKLQVNRNSGGWVDVGVLGTGVAPAALAVISGQYADGDATSTELLSSTSTYVNGEGSEDAETEARYSLSNTETELEWCLQILGFHDGPAQNVAGNTLEFRVVENDGTAFAGSYTNPTITVSETAGYIGGCYAEHPANIGPFIDTNGNLYTFIEHSVNDNNVVVIKSTDGGDTWREMDGANRPIQTDFEGVDVFQDGDTLHIIHVKTAVYYHRFRMSDHSTNPDTWEITDEVIDNTVTSYGRQVGSINKRSDGSIVAFYIDGVSPARCRYKIRNGSWGSQNTVDSEASTIFLSPFSVLGASDKIHLIYKDDTNGILYHRSLSAADSLSARESVATGMSTSLAGDDIPYVPPVYYDSSGDEKVMILYKKLYGSNPMYHRVITNDGSPGTETLATDNDVEESEGGNAMVIAAAAADGTNVFLFYCEDNVYDIWRTSNDDEGGWVTDIEEQDGVLSHWIQGEVITHSVGNGGAKVFGYVWDNGSDGGTGQIWYDEYVIALGGRRVFITHT